MPPLTPQPQPTSTGLNRRRWLTTTLPTGVALACGALTTPAIADEDDRFRFKYLLSSCMYGHASLSEILPEVRRTGSQALDIWPEVHGNQREQLEAMGADAFVELLADGDLKLGCMTQYPLGPFGLRQEFQLAKRLNCHTIVTGGSGPQGLRGTELKHAVGDFCERLKPHLELAEACGVVVAIENHANNLIESPDSLKWLLELRGSDHLRIALAPYHLPQDPEALARLIRELGEGLEVFYAWQHGMGCMKKLPKEQELLQMPGRGDLDFAPIVAALREIKFAGWTSIFMHPVPRGIPILPTIEEVTAEINRSRMYLDGLASPTSS